MTVNRSDFQGKPQRSSVDDDALGLFWDPTDPQGEPFVAPKSAFGGSGGGGAGADGKTVRNGAGAPSSGLGVDGDFYIDTDTTEIYGPKASGVWGSPTSLIGSTVLDWESLGNLGSTETVAGVDGSVYRAYGTLNDNCTVSLSLQDDEQIELLLVQDGTGTRATTFSGVTAWAGNTPSTGSRAAAQVDRYFFERINGSTYGYWLTDEAASGVNALDDLSDVTITTPATGSALLYNGSAWVDDPITAPTFSIHAFGSAWLSTTSGVISTTGGSWPLFYFAAQSYDFVFLLPFTLQAGTWTLQLTGHSSTNRGIVTVETSSDGSSWSSLTTFDTYAGSAGNLQTRNTGLTMPAGVKYLKFSNPTKNGSSSGYLCSFQGIAGVRTGA